MNKPAFYIHSVILICLIMCFGQAFGVQVNAQVSISVTLDGNSFGVGNGVTNGEGELTFTSKNARDGEYETEVTSIVKEGFTFEGSTPANPFDKGVDAVPAAFCLSGFGPSGVSTASPVPIIILAGPKMLKQDIQKPFSLFPA